MDERRSKRKWEERGKPLQRKGEEKTKKGKREDRVKSRGSIYLQIMPLSLALYCLYHLLQEDRKEEEILALSLTKIENEKNLARDLFTFSIISREKEIYSYKPIVYFLVFSTFPKKKNLVFYVSCCTFVSPSFFLILHFDRKEEIDLAQYICLSMSKKYLSDIHSFM